MRKHFLLLFLMALLPLAGFATITVSTQPTLENDNGVTYDGDDKTPVQADGTATGTAVGYTWYYAVNTEDVAPAVDAANTWFTKANLKVQDAGTYYVYYKVVPSVESSEAVYGPIGVGTYTIQKATPVVNTDYTLPKVKTNLTYSAAAQQLINAGTVTNADKVGTLTYTLNNVNYSDATQVKGTNAGTYTVTYTFSGTANYEPVSGTLNPEISAQSIADMTFTFVPGTATRTYGGAWSAPTFTVAKFNNVDVTYEVKWYTNTACTEGETITPTDANETGYYAKIEGTGNFKGSLAYLAHTRDWTFTVAKKKLRILVNPQTLPYNGQVQDASADFTISGWAEADEDKDYTGITVTKVTNTDVVQNVGTYYMKAVVDDNSKIGDDKITKNYDPVILTQGYLKITPLDLTVTVNANKSITFGDALPETKKLKTATDAVYTQVQQGNNLTEGATYYTSAQGSGAFVAQANVQADNSTYELTTPAGYANTDYTSLVTVTGALNDDELNAILAALSLGLEANDSTTQEAIANLNTYYHDVKTYSNCWAISQEANNATLANYDVQVTNKHFVITGAGFTIMAIDANKTYDGNAVTSDALNYLAFDDDDQEVEIPEGVTVTYEYQTDATNDTWSTTLPSAVGTYKYRVHASSDYASGNYDASKIVYEYATLKIKAKKINLIVDAITLHEGDDAAQLNKYAVVSVDENTPLVGNEELAVVFEFTNAVTSVANIWDATNKKLKYSETAADNTKAEAINVRFAVAADFEENGIFEGETSDLKNNGNYEIQLVTKGQLTILAGTSLTFDVEDRILEKMEDADGTTNATVQFQNTLYTIPAGKWRTLVLPFAITPLEFCNAINAYAIFNKLTSATASANTVKFSLEQENLPANTPFLVKSPVAFDLDNISFAGRTIDFEETPTAIVPQAKFIGSYVDVANVPGGDNVMWWKNSENNFVKATDGGVAKAFPNYCFHAYLVLDESFDPNVTARILVEEADGSVTAISSINADGELVPAEGWYNLNGVKLEGVPTEKGVYINNGKKVVIK